MNHTLNTPSASWSVARFPKEVQNYAPTVKEPAMFSALRNGGGNVALNAYAAQAVVAWMKGEHADMALVDVGGSTYAAELPQADGTVLIATVNRPDPTARRSAFVRPLRSRLWELRTIPLRRSPRLTEAARSTSHLSICACCLSPLPFGTVLVLTSTLSRSSITRERLLTRAVSAASATRWW